MGTDALLQVRALIAGYGKKEILRGVDLDVDRGEVVTLLGANGSGKSTVLNTISGFLKPFSGSISLKGEAIGGWPAHRVFRKGIVQLSQARDLFPDLSVRDNVMLGGAVRGREWADEMIKSVFDYFPRLAEREDQWVRTLSGGEQQMVSLGRALMSRPEILLLDEPSGGLAPLFVNEIGAIIRRLKESGTTMLMVEQNIRAAFKIADRFLILRDGRVIDGGRVSTVTGSFDDIVSSIYL